jgi:hypothetical protein
MYNYCNVIVIIFFGITNHLRFIINNQAVYFFAHILGNWVLPSPFLISVINKFPTELNLKMFVFLSTGKTQQSKEKENPNNYPTPSQPPTVSASKLLYSV